jgi:hypothetical protein
MNWTPAAYRLWHRYPQPREAHAERPWWRTLDAAGVTWERVDGRRLMPVRPTADPTDYRRVVWFVGTSDEGREVEGTLAEALAAVDAAEPLDAPPPLVGQVWVWPEHDAGGTEHLVSSVQCWPEGEVWGVQMGGRWQVFGRGADMGEGYRAGDRARMTWPPEGAVLVAGPGAPWAEMREAPERVVEFDPRRGLRIRVDG